LARCGLSQHCWTSQQWHTGEEPAVVSNSRERHSYENKKTSASPDGRRRGRGPAGNAGRL